MGNAVAQAEEAEKKAKLAEANALKVVDDYKKSVAFDEEITEASSYYYWYAYDDCKAKVAKLFSDLDLIKVTIEEAVEEGEI